MKGLLYYIALPFIYFLSLLPFPLLYLFCDFVYFVLYYVVGYRKEVVLQNLGNSFPEKSGKEIKQISKQYYRYFCDLFLETFKTLTISKSSMLKHCTWGPGSKEVFDRFWEEKRSVIIVLGHFGNWEWAGNTFSLTCKSQLFVVYHPLSNKYFDGLMYKMRTHFGTKLIAMKDTFKDMVRYKNMTSVTAFIADQTPLPENAYWTTFLNQETPVFWGTEKIARKLNYPVLYVSLKRKKRGYYRMDVEVLEEEPKNTSDGEISALHTARLEKDIIEQPETWLWTHKRWKHRRPQPAMHE
jgi:KDO2-lipid IV(A) lauroyltransferase